MVFGDPDEIFWAPHKIVIWGSTKVFQWKEFASEIFIASDDTAKKYLQVWEKKAIVCYYFYWV